VRTTPRKGNARRRSPQALGGRSVTQDPDDVSTGVSRSGLSARPAFDQRIGAAVLSIVRDKGLDAVTIESVTARSGVAKTTIYRRYSDRFELLAGVLGQLSPLLGGRSFDLTKEGFVALLRDVQGIFERLFGLAAVGRILASDANLSRQWQDKVIAPQIDGLQQFLAQGVREGLLAPEVDYDRIVDMIIGGMLVSNARRGELPHEWAEQVVNTLWPLIHRRGPSTARSGGRQ